MPGSGRKAALVSRAIGIGWGERDRCGQASAFMTGCPGMMEATAPDSTNPTRWVPKSKAGSSSAERGLDQRRALAQAQGEIVAKRRQDAHPDVGSRDG